MSTVERGGNYPETSFSSEYFNRRCGIDTDEPKSDFEERFDDLIVAPPQEEWGTVIDEIDGKLTEMRVPFTGSELEAYEEARSARAILLKEGVDIGGPNYEFYSRTITWFPGIVKSSYTPQLDNRATTVFGILKTSQAATKEINLFSEDKVGDSYASYKILRDLPGKLIAHKPSSKEI